MTDPVAAQYRDMAYTSKEVWVIQMWDAMNNQLYRKSQEMERLRVALSKYGFHTSECRGGFPISDHCTCGFSDALRSAQPQTGEHKT